MPVPSPKYPLQDSCSVLFNNTLYAYTPQAFQSLPITNGAEWTELEMGVSVTGGVCVKSTPKNDTSAAALYIVGGKSNSTNYQGLQRYNFANSTWESMTPNVPVTQDRLYHGAVYLNTSDTILVFSGTQDGNMEPSSQTFLLQVSDPYSVTAYPATVPPAISPQLMQWTESKAMYIGGSETNTKAMIFSPSQGWVDSNATLATPFYNNSNIKSILINGDDSSKNIYTFDMSVSPNSVNRTILIDADGNPVQNAKPVISSRDVEGELEERSASLETRGNLTVADWPAYNSTLAPSSTRTSWSVAKDQSGLTVISGGNEADVLCMFKARDNTWVNATKTLVDTGSQGTLGGNVGAASPTSSTTVSSPSETTSAAAASNKSSTDPPFPVKILGAVLGSILGLALILIALLFLLRCRRKRKQYSDAGHQRRSSGIPDEKDAMDFADRGLPQMSSARQFRGHEPNPSQGSFSSVAILMGRVNHKRGNDKGNGSVGSDSSSQFNKKYKTAISKPIPQERNLAPIREPAQEDPTPQMEDRPPQTRQRGAPTKRGSTRRSSGWNRYWSGGSAMNILGFGSKRTTYAEDADSLYSDTRQNSAMPPPLKIGGQPELNRVTTGSPTIAHHSSRVPISREMSGQIERSGSISSSSSYTDDRYDAFSSGVPASVHEQSSWTPVDRSDWVDGRTPSSNYSDSVYTSFPIRNTNNLTNDLRFPTPPAANRPPPRNQQSSDMSWLNLGAERL
ncbi:hypothetical protein LSUE1_G006467 [Lachnellula suecica]|uniref:Pre-mRNA splicing factor CLF1 n=1 Tax=Lachnellula suecica TaxID=602035 RepID=A0A8T9C6K1_9HELO|nr:hypothetical protein LSUE1_G006467 [Lachnellula suecica]